MSTTSTKVSTSLQATFETLGLSPDLVDALARDGITEPFPIQALTIPDALAGRDLCGKAKTGSGKTLAFGLPLLERVHPAEPRRPRGLVLTPTRELANQVHKVLAPLAKMRQRRVTAVYGGVSMDTQINALQKGTDTVVGTPGRLIDLIERNEMSLDHVEILVIDEADRMADMGFMPQVQKILHRIGGEHQTMLFSATLDGAVKRLVDRYLHDPVHHEVESDEATVEEMDHRFLLVHQMDKVKVAAAIASGAERTLLFVRTKRGADRLVLQLQREGVRAGGDPRRPPPGSPRACAGRLHRRARWRCSWRPTSPHAASTSTASTWSCTTTPPKTRSRTSTVRAAPPARESRASRSRSCCGTRRTRSGWCRSGSCSRPPIVEVFSNDPRLADLRSWDPVDEAVPA